jgi:hypothetical protein
MHGTSHFAEATVTGLTYLHMLEGWFLSQLKQDFPGQLSSQQDAVAPHFHIAVRDFLDENRMKA